MGLQGLQNVLLGLLAEAVQGADAAIQCGAMQLFDGLHIEIVVQGFHPLRPQAGNLQQFGDRRRQFAVQAFQQTAVSAADDPLILAARSVRCRAGGSGHRRVPPAGALPVAGRQDARALR